jgi:LysM repeat protein
MQRALRPLFITLLLTTATMLALDLATPASAAPATQEQPPAGDPVVIAAGDIARCELQEDSLTAYLLDTLEGTILALGDSDQAQGTLQQFNECFGPTWGRHKDRIRPVPGNHEYLTGGAEGYFTYYGDVATPLEPGCRKECGGYYSFNLGTWHIVALNSEIAIDPGTPQYEWLRADLAANPTLCTLAYWHKPRWTSGRHRSGASAPLFTTLYEFGADVVLSGHDHDYERFAPQGPNGEYEPDRGVRQFVVGTGGTTLRDFRTVQANSEVRNSETWGVLKLTLRPGSYDWEFVPIPGQTFTDKGSAPCVVAPNLPVIDAPVTVSTAPAPATTVAGDAEAEPATVEATTAATVAAPAAIPVEGADYTIQAGDTLFGIAIRYGLDWNTVAAANGLGESSILQIGQVIRLPGVDAIAATPAATSLTPTQVAASAATPSDTQYTVQSGDTLFGLSVRFSVTRAALATANGLQQTSQLQAGQVLTIPGQGAIAATTATTATTAATIGAASPGSAAAASTTAPVVAATATPPPATAATRYHTVGEGDTIITIALEYDLDWQELLRLNGLGPNSLIQIGQRIRLD